MNRADLERLEQLLREDGRRDAPPFSIPLHARALAALRDQGLAQPAAHPQRQTRSWVLKIALPLAAAAAIAVVAWIVLHQTPAQPQKETAGVRPQMPQLTLPEVPASPVADDQFNEARFAYLDRDAMKFWTFLADQLPQLPEPQQK